MSSANVVTYIHIDPPADDVSGQHIYIYRYIYVEQKIYINMCLYIYICRPLMS